MIDILFILGQAAAAALFFYGAYVAIDQGTLFRRGEPQSPDNAPYDERLTPRYIQDSA